MAVYVTAYRSNDPASAYCGRLLPGSFKFHRNRPRVRWAEGQVCVDFARWAMAQRAVAGARLGNFALWDASGRL